jgi:hypothetical protein
MTKFADEMPKFAERVFVWAGGALFVASLALTAWMYALWFADARSPVSGRALALDVVLVTVFALHHSLFARVWMKEALAALWPARLLRSLYVWTASVLLVGVCLLWRPIGGTAYQATSGWAQGIHAVVQLTGVWLIARSVRAIDALELAGIRTAPRGTDQSGGPGKAAGPGGPGQVDGDSAIVEAAGARASDLQVHGVYRLVRHPLYLGWMLIVFGASRMTGDRLAFAAITSVYLVIAIPWEERSLEDAFGSAYTRYKQHVRWRIVPFIY